MNTKRNNEITVVIAAITVVAALLSGLLTARSASAAPGKKTTVTKQASAKRVVKVKMSGSRRAAMNRAVALNNAPAVAPTGQGEVFASGETGSGQTEAYGEPTRVPGTVTTAGTPVDNTAGAYNVPGVVKNFGGNPFALYGPPLVNTGNGFLPLYGTGYNLNGYTLAPFNGTPSPYGNFSNSPNYLYGATNFGY